MPKSHYDYHHLFSPYYSSNYTQKYLRKAYNQLELMKPDMYSYDNCNKFISYIEHGILYFKQLDSLPIQLKPLLLYYGFTHFLKACLLVVDPLYPETTTVLSHGVSTRKKKKQQYEFLFDEVKIQRHGLFTHTAEKIYGIKHLENEKLSMIGLLQEIPELGSLFQSLKNKCTNVEVSFNQEQTIAKLSLNILDHYKMTSERLRDFFNLRWGCNIHKAQQEEKMLYLHFNQVYSPIPGDIPFRFNIQSDTYHLSVQKDEIAATLPDLLILYLLLYNLSMISRYETEWWSDLFKEMPFYDLPFINSILNIAEVKIPFLISEWLNSNI